MVIKMYPRLIESLFNQEVRWTSSNIKLALLDSTYIFNQSHRYFSDLSGEIRGVGYTQGGKLIPGLTIKFNTPIQAHLKMNPVVWSDSTFICRYGVIYCTLGNQPLISFLDFEDIIDVLEGSFEVSSTNQMLYSFTAPQS